MKKFFKLFLPLSILLFSFSCQKKQPAYETAWDSSGNKMVKVQSYDKDGNLLEYFMAYALFNNLFNNGGYGAVNNYYYHNRTAYDRSYHSYNRQYSFSENPKSKSYRKSSPSRIYTSSSSIYRSSTPSRTTTNKSSFFSSSRSSSPSYKSSSSSSSFRSSSSSFRSSSPSRSSSSFRSSSPSRGR